MKSFSLLAAAVLASTAALASPVSQSEALAYANAYVSNILASDRVATIAEPLAFGSATPMYVVSLAPQGWVIIAADDVLDPIIGYSLTGSLSAESVSDNLYAYLGHFAEDAEAAIARGDDKSAAWTTDTIAHTNKAASSVAPLIDVEWNQTGKYRQSCPTSASKGDAIVGCVAVGLGQAMSHYRKPDRPVGYMSYNSANYGTLSVDYDAEPAYDWKQIIAAQNSDNDGVECARFLYHCGVAVSMDYGPDGSGVTYMGNVPYALKTFFGYSNKITNVKKSNYTKDEWVALLKSELSAGHPLIYTGYSTSGGHCFNVDGYDASGLFHFNFGWGGNGNGYLGISSHEYNSGEMCTLNLAPATGAPISISASKTSVSKGLAEGVEVATLSTETDMDGCSFTYEVAGVVNPVTSVIPDPAFTLDGDRLITNSVFAKNYKSSSKARSVSINVTSTNASNGLSLTAKLTFNLTDANALPEIDAAGISVSQSVGSVTVSAGDSPVCVSLVSPAGVSLGVRNISACESASFSGLAPGLYVLSFTGSDLSSAMRVLVK